MALRLDDLLDAASVGAVSRLLAFPPPVSGGFEPSRFTLLKRLVSHSRGVVSILTIRDRIRKELPFTQRRSFSHSNVRGRTYPIMS